MTDSKSVTSLALTLQNQHMSVDSAQAAQPDQDEAQTVILKGDLSQETLTLLGVDANLKRKRSPEDDPRAGYPAEAKSHYLALKELHRKKLSIAQAIVRADSLTKLKKRIPQTDFRCPVPPRLLAVKEYKDDWLLITNTAREQCTKLYIQAIKSLFIKTNNTIKMNFEQLAHLVSEEQLTEMKDTLKQGYIKAAKSLSGQPQKEQQVRKPVKKSAGISRFFQPRTNKKQRNQ